MHITTSHIRILGVALLAAMLGGTVACTKQEPPRVAEAALIERGAYLVTVGGCDDCHTPKVFTAAGPELDHSRRLSGHRADAQLPPVPSGVIGPNQWGAIANNDLSAWAGPWGVSYAANLTADASGLGSWTPEVFIQTLRTGKHAGVGRPILPPMPWFNFKKMTDEDLRAVFAYLRSLPAVSNVVPAPVPPAAGPAPGK